MDFELNEQQRAAQASFRAFADQHVAPFADQFDREERISDDVVAAMAREGYLAAVVPAAFGGSPLDMITYGLLSEELGRASSSVNGLLTVHSMCAFGLARWGTPTQQERWLSRLADGRMIGAFALTEPNVGSDAGSVETTAVPDGDGYLLNGRKRWITFGQLAGLYLVFGKCADKMMLCFVERTNPGLKVMPITGMLGSRAAMLAELHMEDCRVDKDDVILKSGFGFTSMLASVLDIGRYTVAWNCVGLAQACLTACLNYTTQRKQFGKPLKDHQLIQRMIADMYTNLSAARQLCLRAGALKEAGDQRTIMETMVAKYFASTMVSKVANDAVQIHGANGCGSDFPIQRYLRDARIAEIIEGSSQIQQIAIARYSYHQH